MRAHLLTLVACVAFASAVGCTRGETRTASSPQAPAAPQMQPSMQTPELNRATRPEDHSAAKAQALQAPVSITGLVPYADRFDPSGWSGTSMPKATGGGPQPEATDIPTGNEPVGAEQGLVPGAAQGQKPEPPKPPAKSDDVIDEYQ